PGQIPGRWPPPPPVPGRNRPTGRHRAGPCRRSGMVPSCRSGRRPGWPPGPGERGDASGRSPSVVSVELPKITSIRCSVILSCDAARHTLGLLPYPSSDLEEVTPMSAIGNIPVPRNEPVKSYAPGTAERTELQAAIRALSEAPTEIPNVINGEHIFGTAPKGVFSRQRHSNRVADLHGVASTDLERAIAGAVSAQHDWAAMRFEDRAAVF